LASLEPPSYASGIERDIGTAVQTFLGDDLVAEIKNVTRVLHRLEKHAGNPLVSQDRPWERSVFFQTSCYSVVFDSERDQFTCFYQDQDPPSRADPKSPYDRLAGRARARVLRAVSVDGIVWHKPELDRHPHEGRATNIVYGEGVHAFSVLYDERDPDPARRFKMVFTRVSIGINRPKRFRWPNEHGNGLSLAYSADGIEWQEHPDNPIAPASSDVQILTYDEQAGVYVIMGRGAGWGSSSHPQLDKFFSPHRPSTSSGALAPKRLVTRIESVDAVDWSDPEIVLAPDPRIDNLDTEHYGLTTWRRGPRHVGLLNRLHTVPNTMDMELVTSHDGRRWDRFADRNPVLPLGGPGDPDRFIADCPTPPITRGDRLLVFYAGSTRRHDFSWQPPADVEPAELELANKSHLCLASLRLDGWVSLTAMERDGYVDTVPVFSTGSRLVINARCEAGGGVACELRDPWGNVWPGYERDRCDAFKGDATAHVVTWDGSSGVDLVPGNVVIRFWLRRASLFSFAITEA
jgi:hypothetical protein